MHKYFMFLLSVLLITACTPSESIEDKRERLAKTHNIVIGTGDPATFFVPPYTQLNAKMSDGEIFSAEQSSLDESLRGVEDALIAYPDDFVSSQIDAIFIAGNMFFDGMQAGGTYQYSWIIVASTIDSSGESNYNSALYGVHHELSSFIYHKSFVITRFWGDLMPKNWEAKVTDKEALADNYEPIDYENGFLNNYATTSVENDFNTYAEFVFARTDELIELAKQYPLVAKKLRLFINAYSRQSPDMKNLFSGSALEQVAAPNEFKTITDVIHVDTSKMKPTIIYPKEQ
ncbi:hypothetical protein [Pseudocolwellia sp. HL-MZ7]|uniref:hypothetical protein n=1 Tax=Pseudocolwellia sp. HL-MZ7 TaxID=3400627 RepID=UPI003CE73F08